MSEVWLGQIVDLDAVTAVDLAPVMEAVRGVDVRVGVLSDEELHWLGDVDRAPRVFLDAPRLGRLEEDEQRTALERAAVAMAARGELDWDAEPAVVRGVPALVGGVRRASRSVTIVRTDLRGRGTALSAVWEAAPELLLVEHVSAGGLHDFVFRSPALAARALASALDPGGRATATAPPQVAPTVAGLDPHPDAVAARCEASSLLHHSHRTGPGTRAARALTVYSGPDGVWALAGHHRTAHAPGHAAWQQLDRPALVALLTGFLIAEGHKDRQRAEH